MSDTIGQLMGHQPPSRRWGSSDKLVTNNVFIGLEIELENMGWIGTPFRKILEDSGLWTITDDGSLRNYGKEFIMQERGSKQPLMGNDVIAALDAFRTFIEYGESRDKRPSVTERTSIHVHIDVRDFSEAEFRRFVLIYYAFEDIFFKWIGNGRAHNNYCRPAATNLDIIRRVATLLQTDVNIGHALQTGNKYDALNYAAIQTHGSLEIRGMHGTYDTELILAWINILLRIRMAAIDTTINVLEFPEQASANGMEQLLHSIFKDEAVHLVPHATPMDILNGVRVAQEILVVSRLDPDFDGLDVVYANGSDVLTRLDKFKETIGA